MCVYNFFVLEIKTETLSKYLLVFINLLLQVTKYLLKDTFRNETKLLRRVALFQVVCKPL